VVLVDDGELGNGLVFDLERSQDRCSGPLDAVAGSLDASDGSVTTASPCGDVPERVVTGLESERLTDDVCRGLRLQLGQLAIGVLLVEQGVGQLVGQRLHALCRGVGDLDPDAVLQVAAITIGPTGEVVVLDGESDGVSYCHELVEDAGWVISRQAVAHRRQLLAIGLSDVEDWDVLEALYDACVVGDVHVVGLLVDHRSQHVDGLLAFADKAVHLLPGAEARHLGRPAAGLDEDQHDVVGGVVMETALVGEKALPLVGRREAGDAVGELLDEVWSVGCRHLGVSSGGLL